MTPFEFGAKVAGSVHTPLPPTSVQPPVIPDPFQRVPAPKSNVMKVDGPGLARQAEALLKKQQQPMGVKP